MIEQGPVYTSYTVDSEEIHSLLSDVHGPFIIWMAPPLWIRNIATYLASMFTYTCCSFSIVVTSSKYVGNFDHKSNLTWSFELVFLWFTNSSKPSQFINQQHELAWLAGIGKSKKSCT